MASVLEQLMAVLSPEERAIVQSKIDPKLVAQDKKNDELFGYWTGIENGTAIVDPPATVTPPAAAAATHTPTVPNTSTAAASVSTAPPSTDSAAILSALNSLKLSIDDRFKNVVTMDKINELGANVVGQAAPQALRQADEIFTIRDTHRREFNEDWNRAEFEKFVTDNQDPATKRNRYPTLTDAYNAMVAEKRIAAKIATGIADGVKQKTSGATVPGQTTSSALSPAQQVMAKAKAAATGNADGKSNIQSAIDRLAAMEAARGAATVQ